MPRGEARAENPAPVAIVGYVNADDFPPAPYVEAEVHILRLGLRGKVNFLIDTGADATSLHPGDLGNLGITSRALRQERIEVNGVGGSIAYALEDAAIACYDGEAGGWRYFPLRIQICAASDAASVQGVPSLLGRDVLNRCALSVNAASGSVVIEPLRVDEGSGIVLHPFRVP